MNGAEAVFRALVEGGITTCFANPGTTEMWLVREIGLSDKIQPILCLHENVVTGAADGYGRMTGTPALSLLHVACGLTNGLANLHNAARAHTPMVNLVGGNATYHVPNQPELEFIGSGILNLARSSSHWSVESKSADDLALQAARAVQEAKSDGGKICTLVAPTNHLWEETRKIPSAQPTRSPTPVPSSKIEQVAGLLKNGNPTALLLGHRSLHESSLEVAGRIAAATGCLLLAETFASSRFARGAGRVPISPVPYLLEPARQLLSEVKQLILVGASVPRATMAYQGKGVEKVPSGTRIATLAGVDSDLEFALKELAAAVGATAESIPRQKREKFDRPTGPLTTAALAETIASLAPTDFILVDEGATVSFEALHLTRGARRHDYLFSPTGAAIGAGMPQALGAAVACPGRKVVNLQADGSAMYTLMTLWTMARLQTDTIVIILKNNAYAILEVELARVLKGPPNSKMRSLLELANPELDWIHLARGQGVAAHSANSAEEFHDQFARAVEEPGPHLIEANLIQDLRPMIDLVRQA